VSTQNEISRRRFLQGVGIGSLGLGLAACGATPVSPTNTPQSAATAAPAATATTAAAVTVEPTATPIPKTVGSKGNINVIYWSDRNDSFKSLMEAFTEETDIGVTYELAPSDYAEFYNMMRTRLAGGDDTIDIAIYRDMMGNQLLAADFLLDVNPILEDKKVSISDIPSRLIESVTVDGRLSMLPNSHDAELLFWRTDWAEEAGVGGPPATWEEWREKAAKLTQAPDRYGIGLCGLKSQVCHEIQKWSSQAGASLLKVDHPGLKEAIVFYKELFATHKVAQPSTPEDGYYDTWLAYQENKFSSWWCWDAYFGYIKDNKDFWNDQVILAPPAAGPQNADINTACWGWVVGAHTRKQELCAEWIRFVGQPENQKIERVLRPGTPSRISLWSDPEVQERAPSASILANIVKEQGEEVLAGLPNSPNYAEIVNVFSDEVHGYFTDQIDVDAALKNYKERVTKLL